MNITRNYKRMKKMQYCMAIFDWDEFGLGEAPFGGYFFRASRNGEKLEKNFKTVNALTRYINELYERAQKVAQS